MSIFSFDQVKSRDSQIFDMAQLVQPQGEIDQETCQIKSQANPVKDLGVATQEVLFAEVIQKTGTQE